MVDFSVIYTKEDSFHDFLFVFLHLASLKLVSTLKGNILLLGSKFFLICIDPLD